MTTQQQNKARMVLATLAVLLKHREAWKAHEAFSESVEEFNRAVKDIDEMLQRHVAKNGATISKESAEFLLGRIAFQIAGATYAYAVKTGDTALAGSMAYAPSEIVAGSQTAIHARCLGILATATKMQSALGKFGVSPDRLELLRERAEAYRVAQTRPREEQAAHTAVSRAVSEALTRATGELTQQLDKLVVQFEEEDPQFVDAYRVARRIVSLQGSTSVEKPPLQPTSDPPPAPVIPPGKEVLKAA